MELFLLCTILMALVSYCSMAIAKPPAINLSETIKTNTRTISTTSKKKEANIIEFNQEKTQQDLIGLATA